MRGKLGGVSLVVVDGSDSSYIGSRGEWRELPPGRTGRHVGSHESHRLHRKKPEEQRSVGGQTTGNEKQPLPAPKQRGPEGPEHCGAQVP